MKKLFAALASAALVGTVFAQTGAPASATQPQAGADQAKVVNDKSATPAKAHKDMKGVSTQGNEAKAQTGAGKEKAERVDAYKSAAKDTHHMASVKTTANNEAGKTKAEVKNVADTAKQNADVAAKPEAKAAASANGDKTKKQ